MYHNTLTENAKYKAADVLGFLIKREVHTHICSVHSQQAKNRDIKEEQILSPCTSKNPFHTQTVVLLAGTWFWWKAEGSVAAKVSHTAVSIITDLLASSTITG